MPLPRIRRECRPASTWCRLLREHDGEAGRHWPCLTAYEESFAAPRRILDAGSTIFSVDSS
jgi:hypothetical protein